MSETNTIADRPNIPLLSFVEVILPLTPPSSGVPFVIPGILKEVGERGVLLGASDKQIADNPRLTSASVSFIPWTNVLCISVASEV